MKPEAIGLSPTRLAKLDQVMTSRYVDGGHLPGILTQVYRRGKLAHTGMSGHMDIERGKPMREDAIFRIYSMTKPITGIALMMLVEDGLIGLDDAVATHIPSWKKLGVYQSGMPTLLADQPPAFITAQPDRPMKVVDLVTHTSGLTYGFMMRTAVDAAYRKLGVGDFRTEGGLDGFVDQLAGLPLEFSPGSQWNYSVSIDVMGYLVQKLSGMSFGEFLRTRLFEPLGMTDTAFFVPPEKIERFTSCYQPKQGGGLKVQDDAQASTYAKPPSLESGGGGLVSTAHDYMQLCRMMLGGGTVDGVQILSPKTVELFSLNHLEGGKELSDMAPPGLFSEAGYSGIGFSIACGVNVNVAKTRLPGTLGEYFWGGAASTAFWIDPKEDLAVVFMTQVMGTDARLTLRRDLRTLVYSAMTDSSPKARMFKRVLIANRGEIAIRIARAAAGLGIESVAVYALADALALHTRVADEARALPATADPVKAYLDIDALVAAAEATGCDCVHPGYGFLSENADFARACQAAGLAFVGPNPETLELFGDKTWGRALAASLNIPIVPGSDAALETAEAATVAAEGLGWPVMLKASAGGGGRGMRRVDSAADMPAAFARCQGEAEGAFGDRSVFAEKLVEQPRHIEVQILADRNGAVVHLFERDCSVQQRNQKVVEIAPAPGLAPALRERILGDAVKLAQSANYVNAGTVEFLVDPQRGEHWFIECNPRIQVEHTVTEEITGIDLVEAQFRIEAGETLADLGLASQAAVTGRGFAIQARIAATGAGVLTGYKEPTGPGVRVDSCGYLGLAPPPQFDPMFAKLIARAATYEAAVDKTLRALGEFHIAGLPTNLPQLRAILSHPDVQAGDARTSFLADHPGLAAAGKSDALALIEAQAAALGGGATITAPAAPTLPSLEVPDGETGVVSPMAGSVVEVSVAAGETVAAGDTLMVVSAMKMETAVTAPCAGVVGEVAALAAGDAVALGQVVVTIVPGDGAAGAARTRGVDTWAPLLAEVKALQDIAHARFAPGSTDPGVVRQRSRGKLTCRERIDLVLDAGTFREVGSVAGFASYDDEGRVADFTPANHVGGWGKVEGRSAVVCADDFTSRGGHADGAVGAKSGYLDRLSLEMQCPSIRLLDGSSGGGSVATMVPKQAAEGESAAQESSGAIKAGRPRVAGGGGSFLPGHLGSSMFAEQLATVPVVNLLLGSVVGIGAAKAVLGHFSVMVKDIAQLFVAGPPVVSHAMGYDITKEDLGDWRVHCTNGSVDNLAQTEEDAVAQTKRFLSYLPSSVYEPPPVIASDDPADRREEELFTLVPRKRTTTFDMRRAVALMADEGSFFEVGPLWGTDQITGFVRFGGYPMGVLASDSRHINGGALTADGCDKLKRHIDVCDLFHLPILNLIDNPGFAVGLEHERAGTIRKGGEWMIAFAQAEVPIFTVIMRRSFGVAGNNFATPRSGVSSRVVWPAADVGGIPPEGGIEAAYKRQLAEAADPAALRAEIDARIESARGPVGPLNRFQMEEMIDPRDTRRLVCEWVENAWRMVAQPGRLGPRALGFRP